MPTQLVDLNKQPASLLSMEDAMLAIYKRKTVKNKRSRVNRFEKYLTWINEQYPIEVWTIGRYAAQLIEWEYNPASVKVIAGTVIAETCKMSGGFLEPNGAPTRKLNELEDGIKRLCKRKDIVPMKCKPAQRSGKGFTSLSNKEKAQANIWLMLGPRESSLEEVGENDVKILPNGGGVQIRFWEDKIANVIGRTAVAKCNCVQRKGGKVEKQFCPIHCGHALKPKDFPIPKATRDKIKKALGTNGHGPRRHLAPKLRQEHEMRVSKGEKGIQSLAVGTHVGWEAEKGKCLMFDYYTADYHQIDFEGMQTFPIQGVLDRVEELSTKKGMEHKFPRRKRKTKELLVHQTRNKADAKGRVQQRKTIPKKVKITVDEETSSESAPESEESRGEDSQDETPKAGAKSPAPTQKAKEVATPVHGSTAKRVNPKQTSPASKRTKPGTPKKTSASPHAKRNFVMFKPTTPKHHRPTATHEGMDHLDALIFGKK